MRRRALASILSIFGVTLPLIALAATVPPLVPCTTADVGSTACTLCQGVTLIQNVINYAILLSFPIAAILFAYAGFRYFTSGGNQTTVTDVHKIFKAVAIGFVFVIAGYLIVNTILHTLIISTNSSVFSNASWFSVGECKGTRPTQEKVSTWLGGLFSVQPTITPGPSTQTPDAVPNTQDTSPGVGTTPGAPNTVEANIQNGITSLDNNAGSTSLGKCAYAVRTNYLAPAGFTDFNTNHPVAASDYGPYLANDGFTVATKDTWNGYTPQPGDIAVFQPVAEHSNGHIQVYDGTQWVSDFKQNGFFPASAYGSGGSYTIYHSPRKPQT